LTADALCNDVRKYAQAILLSAESHGFPDLIQVQISEEWRLAVRQPQRSRLLLE